MSAVCIIPARGGSRRIPRKNIREFRGRPIIAYSIAAAFESEVFGAVYVSTEDDEIAAVARHWGAQVLGRHPMIAEDNVPTQDVMRYHLEAPALIAGKFEYACCLYPCAPMMESAALEKAARVLRQKSAAYVVPVATWLRDPGQFYFGDARAFAAGHPLIEQGTVMIPIDPRTECDINTEDDWVRAEKMYDAWINRDDKGRTA